MKGRGDPPPGDTRQTAPWGSPLEESEPPAIEQRGSDAADDLNVSCAGASRLSRHQLDISYRRQFAVLWIIAGFKAYALAFFRLLDVTRLVDVQERLSAVVASNKTEPFFGIVAPDNSFSHFLSRLRCV